MHHKYLKLALVISAAFILSIPTMRVAAAEKETKSVPVIFNSIKLVVNLKPVKVGNMLFDETTYAPLRAVAEMLGKKVEWDGNTQTVNISDTSDRVSFGGEENSLAQRDETITADFNQVNLAVNGKPVQVDNLLYNGTTYVPVRAVAELLGKTVDWDDVSLTSSINDPVLPPQPVQDVDDPQLMMCYQPRPDLKIGFNLNNELLSIAAAHSTDFQHKGYMGRTPLNIVTMNYFSRFAKRPYSEDLNRQSTSDVVVNKFTNGETGAVLVFNKSLDQMLYPLETNRPFAKTGSVKSPSELAAALRDFKEYTKADEFFKANQDAYREIIEEFRSKMSVDHISAIEDVLGMKIEGARFNVILSPTNNGGTAVSTKDEKGNYVFFNVTNPTLAYDSWVHVLFHEEVHNFLRPILVKEWAKYDNKNFVDVLNNDVGSSNAFNETVTRALTKLVLDKYHPEVDTDAYLQREINRGWVNTDRVYELIKNEYLNHRDQYKTIEDFMPRILDYLNQLPKTPPVASPVKDYYGVKLGEGSQVFIYGSRDFCEGIKKQIGSGVSIGRMASISFFDESILGKAENVIIISSEYNYQALPNKIKSGIEEQSYNTMQSGDHVSLKLGENNVIIVK